MKIGLPLKVIILLFFIPIFCFGQIKEIEIKKPTNEIVEVKYDTLTNFPQKWEEYIGQSITFLPLDTNYELFYRKYDCFYVDSNFLKHYGGIDETPKELIDNQTFLVLNCKFTSIMDKNGKNSGLKFSLLQNNDTIYWKIPYCIEYNSVTKNYVVTDVGNFFVEYLPVLINSYIDKIKKNIGITFIAKNTIYKNNYSILSEYEMTDINTGSSIDEINKNDRFKCIDIAIMASETHFKQPFLIFQDSIGRMFRVSFMHYAGYIYDAKDRLRLDQFYTESEYKVELDKEKEIQLQKEIDYKKRLNECVKLFGQQDGTLIANGKVKLGMTCKMCIYAWGEPDDKNITIGSFGTHEQWVYGDDSYLYFENGKLTGIQN